MSLHALAGHMATKGRGGDSMLVHMTPGEVAGLQALAVKHGGELTINPDTGLPEANFLKKLLPTLIGAGLTYFSGGVINPMMAAGIVGGVETARTGDIGRGLSAGLGAYGGAGMTASLTGAGANAIGANASTAAQLAGETAATEAGRIGLEQGFTGQALDAVKQQALEEAANASGMEAFKATAADKLSAGFDAVTKDPASAGAFLKANAKPLMYSAAPLLAGDVVQAKMPQTVTRPGMIRPYSFDPYGGTFTAGTPYEATPTRAAEGGLMGMNNGGYSPGQLDFTQRSEPVVRMASGGIAALAAGGVSDQDVQNWFATNTGANDAQIAAAMQQFNVAPEQISRVTGVGMPEVQQRYETAIAPQIVGTYTGGVAGPGGTTAVRGTGYLGIQDQLENAGVTAQELFNNPNYKGWALPELEQAYNVANKIQQFDTGANSAALDDKAWASFMDANKFSVRNIAQATGLSEAEVQRRYDAAKFKPPIVTTTTLPTVITGNTQGPGLQGGVNDLTNVGIDRLLPGVSGLSGAGQVGGGTVVNPNGTITTSPRIPGIPVGGFTGMENMRNVYTERGGSLGYVPYAPKTVEEFNTKYADRLTGGSQQSYDYLTGKKPYDPTPSTETGEIQKPYWESVGRFPENRSTKKYVYVNGKYQLNPDYVKPSYVLAGEKAAVLANQDKEPTDSPGAGNKWVWNSTDKKWEAKPVADTTASTGQNDGGNGGEANGGLMKLAGGGMAGQYNLGSYSDGGRLLRGPGDGVSDSIPATIGNKRPARLADGEFVVPARIVSELGNGSTEAGARKLYAMMDRVQAARRGTVGKKKVAKNSRADKYLPA